jgi:hypothetical protein
VGQRFQQQDAMSDAYAAARRRVEQRGGLAVHWLVFLVINAVLVVGAGGFAGSAWRLAGWGLGLALHTVYVLIDVDELKDRLVRREVERSVARVQ